MCSHTYISAFKEKSSTRVDTKINGHEDKRLSLCPPFIFVSTHVQLILVSDSTVLSDWYQEVSRLRGFAKGGFALLTGRMIHLVILHPSLLVLLSQ